MNGLPYYKRYPRDFIEGTAGMPLDLKGPYSVLLDVIYIQNGRCPDDPHYIAGQLGCSVRKWNAIRKDLIAAGKIKAENGIISNIRADKEREILSKYQDKQSENASQPRKNNNLQQPKASHTEPEPESKDTNVSSLCDPPLDCPDLFDDFWDQYPHRGAAKKGKAEARKSWDRAIKAKANPSQIIQGAMRYATDAQVIRGFAKNPSTWLNQQCWNDDVEIEQRPSVGTGSGSSGGMVAAFAAVAARRTNH